MTLDDPDESSVQLGLPFDPPLSPQSLRHTNLAPLLRGCWLVVDNPRESSIDHPQLDLGLPRSSPNLLRFAPRRAYAFLDFGLIALFGGDPQTRRAALRLERRGVWTIGDLISCPRPLVVSAVERDAVALDLIEAQLREFDLGFGYAVPNWRGSQGFCQLAQLDARRGGAG